MTYLLQICYRGKKIGRYFSSRYQVNKERVTKRNFLEYQVDLKQTVIIEEPESPPQSKNCKYRFRKSKRKRELGAETCEDLLKVNNCRSEPYPGESQWSRVKNAVIFKKINPDISYTKVAQLWNVPSSTVQRHVTHEIKDRGGQPVISNPK